MQEKFEKLIYFSFRSKLLEIVPETPKKTYKKTLGPALVKIYVSRKRRNHQNTQKET